MTMTNIQPVTDKEARDYVAAYLTSHKMPVELGASFPSIDEDNAIDVIFIEAGYHCRFTVWRESNGAIYGEW